MLSQTNSYHDRIRIMMDGMWWSSLIVEAAAGVVAVQIVAVFAAWVLGSQERFLQKYLGLFVSAAVGVLLATALLHLLPEAISRLGNRQAVWVLVGGTMLALFCGERIFQAAAGAPTDTAVRQIDDCRKTGDCPDDHAPDDEHAHEHHHHHRHTQPHNIVAASMLHSFIDGSAVASAFAAGSRVGWITTFAIALHEVPHRMGDFALFIHLRVPNRRALALATLAGVPALAGVLFVALLGLGHAERTTWLLPISAAGFLYIASVNLIPEMAHETRARPLALQLLSLCVGVLLVVAAAGLFPS
jgi:zinc and cadmium transporter